MPIPFDKLQDPDSLIIMRVTDSDDNVVYLSTRHIDVSYGGIFLDIYPNISESITVGYECNFLVTEGADMPATKPTGFMITDTVLLEGLQRYYGAKVECFVGTTDTHELESYSLLYDGIVSNILWNERGTLVTLSDDSLSLKKNILQTYYSRPLPVVLGSDTNFSSIPVNVEGNDYHVISSYPATISSIKDSNGNDVPYNLVVYEDWTVIETTAPTDTNLVISAEAGSGTIGDLIQYILSVNDLVLDSNDLAEFNTRYPEFIGIQLFEQATYGELLNVLLHGTNHVWYCDLNSKIVRLKPFERTEPAMTVTDNMLTASTFKMSYFTRPFTSFRVLYNLTWHDLKADQVSLESPLAAQLDPTLHKKYPDIVFPTKSQAKASEIANDMLQKYGDGLYSTTLDMSIVYGSFEVGDTIRIESDFLQLYQDFFVQSVQYSDVTKKITTTVITI